MADATVDERTPLVNADGSPRHRQTVHVAVQEQVQRRPEDEAAKALEDAPETWTRRDVLVTAFWVLALTGFGVWFIKGIRDAEDLDVRARLRVLSGQLTRGSLTCTKP